MLTIVEGLRVFCHAGLELPRGGGKDVVRRKRPSLWLIGMIAGSPSRCLRSSARGKYLARPAEFPEEPHALRRGVSRSAPASTQRIPARRRIADARAHRLTVEQ